MPRVAMGRKKTDRLHPREAARKRYWQNQGMVTTEEPISINSAATRATRRTQRFIRWMRIYQGVPYNESVPAPARTLDLPA